MTALPRTASLLSALLIAAACSGTGTDLASVVAASEHADASADAGLALGGDGSTGASSDPFAGTPTFSGHNGPSTHNAGMSCIQSGCHNSSNEAPRFLVGGTVYADYAGSKPAPGVEVRAIDGAGHAVSVYSSPEGNFYIATSSAQGLTFPLTVGARDATTTRPMITTLTSADASCGQASCHVPGGGPPTSTGNYYPIHVP